MTDYDVLIKNGTIVDGTRVPRFKGDLWIKDGRIAQIGGRAQGQGHQGNRRRRADRGARLRRSAHPLRRADPVGSLLHDLRLARRHIGGPRQLRLRLRAGDARRPRPGDAHHVAHRGHSVRVHEGRHDLGLGDLPGVAQDAGAHPQGCELPDLHARRAAHDLGDGPRSRQDASGHAPGAGRDEVAAARSHGRRRLWILRATLGAELRTGRLRRHAHGDGYHVRRRRSGPRRSSRRTGRGLHPDHPVHGRPRP